MEGDFNAMVYVVKDVLELTVKNNLKQNPLKVFNYHQ